MMYIDDTANVNMIGMLYSGGVQFSNGMQVVGGSSITYDANNSLQLSSLGTQIAGPFSVNGDITFNNLTQTSITAKKSLVLSQTGYIWIFDFNITK